MSPIIASNLGIRSDHVLMNLNIPNIKFVLKINVYINLYNSNFLKPSGFSKFALKFETYTAKLHILIYSNLLWV